jgi:tetratricopeptide (TPR) repeat protein
VRSINLKSAQILLALVAVAASPLAHAFNFVVRQSEWDTWPAECRARYSITKAANMTPYAATVPAGEVQTWENRIGRESWVHMHHYCAGLAYLHRAGMETDPKARSSALHNAAREAGYTYSRIQAQSSQTLFVDVSLALAEISLRNGEPGKSIRYLEKAAQQVPRDERIYLAMSSDYRKQGKMDLALQALKRGEAATGGGSATLHYYLGLASLESGDKQSAVEYARKAYSAGFPLPGLRNKLAAAGVSLNP